MSSFPENENYDELRVLVDCYHPMHIPQDITASDYPHSVVVHFELEGWLISQAINQQGNQRNNNKREQPPPTENTDLEAQYWRDDARNVRRPQINSSDSDGSSGPVTRFNRHGSSTEEGDTENPKMERPRKGETAKMEKGKENL